MMTIYHSVNNGTERYSKIIVPLYIFLLALLFFINQFESFKVFYLIGGLFLGVYYLKLNSGKYIGLMLVFFMFSPIFRRLIDWKFGTDSNSLILLTPSLISLLCVTDVLKSFRILNRRKYTPYVLALTGVILGFVVGAVNNGLLAALYDFLSWAGPIFVSIYIILQSNLDDNLQYFVKTMIYAAFFMGLYAVFQYVFAPPWDTQWLINSGLTSQGRPMPYSLRVWSTMNSTGIYAIFAMAGLLLAQFARSYFVIVLYIIGLLGLSLTLVRTAWIGLLLGLIIFLLFQKIRNIIKYAFLITFVIVGSYFTLLNTPFYIVFSSRINTLNNISNDGSFKDRQEVYLSETSHALLNVIGDGLGSSGLASKLSAGNVGGGQKGFDSGILNTLNSLGWFGTYLYAAGIILAIIFSIPKRKSPPIAAALFSISLVCIVQMFSYSSNVGVQGLLFWIPLALASKIKLVRNFNV